MAKARKKKTTKKVTTQEATKKVVTSFPAPVLTPEVF